MLVPAILAAADLELVGAVSRTHSGHTLGELPDPGVARLLVSRTVEDGLLAGANVLI